MSRTNKALNNEAQNENRAALNFEFSPPAHVPDWIMLLPAGPEIVGRDGRAWKLDDPQSLVENFHSNKADLPIDIEHSTEIKGPNGDAAPAVGWIKALEIRDSAVWGQVEWTNDGKIQVGERGYRYISPVFLFDIKEKQILRLTSAALTNQPNLALPALNRQQQKEETTMDLKQLLALLGLPETATVAEAMNAVKKLQGDLATAANRADTPSFDKFVPRADYDLAVTKATNAEQKLAEIEKAEQAKAINAEIDKALEAGKIAPASRDFYIASCRAEGGLAAFKKFVETAPVIAKPSELDSKELDTNGVALNADQQKIAGMFGNSAEDLKKYGA